MPPAHLGLYVLGVSLVAAIVLVGLGAARVARSGRALQARFDAYSRLPIVGLLESTEARLSATQQRAAGLPGLQARSVAALAEIEAARVRILGIWMLVRFAVRKALSLG